MCRKFYNYCSDLVVYIVFKEWFFKCCYWLNGLNSIVVYKVGRLCDVI